MPIEYSALSNSVHAMKAIGAPRCDSLSDAGVAQRQSRGFVNLRLGVRFLSPAPHCSKVEAHVARINEGSVVSVIMGRYPSGQRGQAVNLLRKLRRFEPFPPHCKMICSLNE